MIKCLECGFEAERLQWTHFRFNCTGRFKNGKEYMAAYPGSLVVSKELSSKTAITLENLIKKYGYDEGNRRWDSYKKKQAESNSYEYKKEKYGWDKEKFDEYNLSRSQTLENMIKRYGEELGTLRWNEYKQRQAYTNSLNYFVSKYGQDKGLAEFKRINLEKGNSSNPCYVSKKLGISLDDAVNIVANRFKLAYTSNIEKEFVTDLSNTVGQLEYSNLTKPYGKWSKENNSYYVFDIKHKDVIIEFNGDYWHANPKIYSENDLIRNRKAKDIWEMDKKKLELAKSHGFRVKVVWESDYISNRGKVIKEVAEWILSGQL